MAIWRRGVPKGAAHHSNRGANAGASRVSIAILTSGLLDHSTISIAHAKHPVLPASD